MTAKQARTDEDAIAGFWTERPMTFGALRDDVLQADPRQVMDSVKAEVRQKLPQYSDATGRVLGALIDYDALAGKEVLEIGYGTGWLTDEMLKAGARVHGIDLSETHHELCSRLFGETGRADLRLASAERIPFPDGSFDFVASWGVLHHAADDLACYRELHRVLRHGGTAFLMLYRRGGPKYWWRKILRKGLLQGGLARHGWNIDRFINSVTDAYQNDSPGAPISRHYRRADIGRQFAPFASVDAWVGGNIDEWGDLPFGHLPITNVLPRAARARLVGWSGAYWLVRLRK